ncbi:VirB3 family type IV secretion system protein [Variovorax sp. J22P168]|uniref:VirB3 family type IV secretion system protein n=1 Tax=Variovorax jilinensis TaxID=3053513 RepID=UPI0025756423|nr:VirB3 family type IV secretion system protein [Variovorax sp. J22P168]MDM0015051.1 VirB3 family type IV secretion system protein [Variovorax sp. J22P168]
MTHDTDLYDEGETLVAAMTRPTMIGGFTLASLAMSLYLPGMAAMVTRSIWAVALVPVLLLACYLVCLKDVYLFNILSASTRLKPCANKSLWGCRRYAPR